MIDRTLRTRVHMLKLSPIADTKNTEFSSYVSTALFSFASHLDSIRNAILHDESQCALTESSPLKKSKRVCGNGVDRPKREGNLLRAVDGGG